MKLLIITQSVDKNNPILGFFHRWIEEFSKHFEKVTVICLEKGECNLPSNVKVLSLGKEDGKSRIKYIFNFYKYIWNERKNYETVFVHMNQEYILLGSLLWKILGKKITMWRNHHAGNFLTDISAFFCTKVFCPSKFSYTAKYKKSMRMPVGVDTEKFNTLYPIAKEKGSILFLGRIAPVKRPDLLINALYDLKLEGVEVSASFYGDPQLKDKEYYESLQKIAGDYGLANVLFKKGVPNTKAPKIYAAYDVFVNLSSSGMYDKTIIEAMASGCLVLASNENLRKDVDDMFIFKEGNREDLVLKLRHLLFLSSDGREKAKIMLREFAERHSLKALGEKLYKEISS